MKVSVIIGLVFWGIFFLASIFGEVFFSFKEPKKIIKKSLILFFGFIIGAIIFCLLGLFGYLILAPLIEFFDINWWFITISF